MNYRILVVEDDLAIADALAIHLKYAGYDYEVFHNGLDMVDALSADHNYDLALLDIMLPGIDGFQLFKHMEAYKIPVIYMTAKTDSESEIQGLRSGAEDYITKPFHTMTLLVRIEKVLARFQKTNTLYQVQDLTIDIANRKVTKNQHEIKLTPIEFDVLHVLVKYKNRTISRDTLLNEVWGNDYYGDTRTIDVRISQLRKKLDLGDMIKTISKTGYRLDDNAETR